MLQANAASAKAIREYRHHMGLDDSLLYAYGKWMWRLIHLDLGTSFGDGQEVLKKLREALPITVGLSMIALLITYLVAIPVGIYSAVKPGSMTDRGLTVGLFMLYSMPSQWVAVMLIVFFGTRLHWLPIQGLHSEGSTAYVDLAKHLLLPIVCLTYATFASLSRYMRSGMLEVIRQDYIRTARAKGLSERAVILRHALRNSLISIITLLGLTLPSLVGGAVIVERIFGLPGMGQLSFEAIQTKDIPVLDGRHRPCRRADDARAAAVRRAVRGVRSPDSGGGRITSRQSFWSRVWRQLKKRKLTVVALGVIGVLVLVAVFADFIASDLPIMLHYQGRMYFLPNMIDYPALQTGTITRCDRPCDPTNGPSSRYARRVRIPFVCAVFPARLRVRPRRSNGSAAIIPGGIPLPAWFTAPVFVVDWGAGGLHLPGHWHRAGAAGRVLRGLGRRARLARHRDHAELSATVSAPRHPGRAGTDYRLHHHDGHRSHPMAGSGAAHSGGSAEDPRARLRAGHSRAGRIVDAHPVPAHPSECDSAAFRDGHLRRRIGDSHRERVELPRVRRTGANSIVGAAHDRRLSEHEQPAGVAAGRAARAGDLRHGDRLQPRGRGLRDAIDPRLKT